MFAVIGQKIQERLNANARFTATDANNGDDKVFPVIINQTTSYPATIYSIEDVSNFISKGNSLDSCDVVVRVACFADSYATTYNQGKAIVESLDLYSVTYTEDGQSYTAKFNFSSLSDEYHNTAEVYYKDLFFNCLIIKN